GAASGGLWKTTNGGLRWQSIFDDQSASSVSALAIAPTDANQIWAGTGETFVIRPAHAMGDGIYKSNDAGKTWSKMGLESTGRIGRIVIHPSNPDIVYVAALGHTYGPQQDKGVYRTKDGGKNWEKVLFVDEGTGAADVTINPSNPDILYAGMWSIHINTWGLTSGGPGGGIYRSVDGGDTWEALTAKGLPGGEARPVGKNAVALCHSKPNVVYALFEIESPALYRSDDNGESWTLMSRNHTMAERASYYTRIAVAPDNADELYFLGVRFSKSIDAGKTLVKRPPRLGGDTHDIWIDPSDANRIMVAHDGCASVTLDRGKSTQNIKLPIAQMYHVAVDNQIPYNVYGNRQDGYSYRGPSNSQSYGIPLEMWRRIGGCECGFAQPDPIDNNIVWSGCYDGGLERFDLRTGYAREVRVWPEAAYGWKPADLKYRWHWNFPMSFSPHVPHRVYVGSQHVHKSDDGGQSWQTISPDLTLNLKSHQQSSGGVAIDNLMTYDGSVLFAIEESPIDPGLIWVGSNDGQVSITKDYGKNWENITANIPDMPEWGTISCIEPSKYDAGTAYLALDMHQMGDFDPYIYQTKDYGKTWTKISANFLTVY
ncbi:MAG: glycosyl hydrolase, partial [Bacteroidota bacterium]